MGRLHRKAWLRNPRKYVLCMQVVRRTLIQHQRKREEQVYIDMHSEGIEEEFRLAMAIQKTLRKYHSQRHPYYLALDQMIDYLVFMDIEEVKLPLDIEN